MKPFTWSDIIEQLQAQPEEPILMVEKTPAQWRAILTPEQYHVTREKGTERPGSSLFCQEVEPGTYTCVCCGALLFEAAEKFDSGTGWPSFAQPVSAEALRYCRDHTMAGMPRVEMLCSACDAHLGHVFPDGPPPSGLRYCVNGVALNKQSSLSVTQTAVLAGGCFWCTEAIFQTLEGVLSVESGYCGGTTEHPTYTQVCAGATGHAEGIKITYNPQIITYAALLKLHLATHDPTTLNQQGADEGTQYRSVIFYASAQEQQTATEIIQAMQLLYDAPIVTQLAPLTEFYPAEAEHQNYYRRNPQQPYCQYVIQPKLEKLLTVLSP